MGKIKNLIERFKTPIYDNWYLNTKVGDLVEVLQITLDDISQTHLGKSRQYWTKFCIDTPWKYKLVVWDKTNKIFTSFTIPEMFKALNNPPAKCYGYILNKILKGDVNMKDELNGAWERIHDLEEENARYWEMIVELEKKLNES